MFSISKNPQASMTEILVKAEKYISGEEALLSKAGSSSTHKVKEKRKDRSPMKERSREKGSTKREILLPKKEMRH